MIHQQPGNVVNVGLQGAREDDKLQNSKLLEPCKVNIETGGSLPWTREQALSPPAHSSPCVYVVLSYLLVP